MHFFTLGKNVKRGFPVESCKYFKFVRVGNAPLRVFFIGDETATRGILDWFECSPIIVGDENVYDPEPVALVLWKPDVVKGSAIYVANHFDLYPGEFEEIERGYFTQDGFSARISLFTLKPQQVWKFEVRLGNLLTWKKSTSLLKGVVTFDGENVTTEIKI
ncbi:MAG: hypothetical protein KatS3mg087_1329 [Patescibacteria group bacterium]|nr:MAG: hypothetical protein KatS3mg087_1329 [Patescibacteria group bacterium]